MIVVRNMKHYGLRNIRKRCRSAEGVLNGRRLRRRIVRYLRTATYEIAFSIMSSNL
jgi:hypothetical protein